MSLDVRPAQLKVECYSCRALTAWKTPRSPRTAALFLSDDFSKNDHWRSAVWIDLNPFWQNPWLLVLYRGGFTYTTRFCKDKNKMVLMNPAVKLQKFGFHLDERISSFDHRCPGPFRRRSFAISDEATWGAHCLEGIMDVLNIIWLPKKSSLNRENTLHQCSIRLLFSPEPFCSVLSFLQTNIVSERKEGPFSITSVFVQTAAIATEWPQRLPTQCFDWYLIDIWCLLLLNLKIFTEVVPCPRRPAESAKPSPGDHDFAYFLASEKKSPKICEFQIFQETPGVGSCIFARLEFSVSGLQPGGQIVTKKWQLHKLLAENVMWC